LVTSRDPIVRLAKTMPPILVTSKGWYRVRERVRIR
jgi:hypothetical protein